MSNIVDRFKSLVGKKTFTVKFVKKDGSERIMNAMLGVKKHVKGTMPDTTDKRNKTLYFTNMVGCYEMKGTSKDIDEKNYKTINLDTLVWLKANGKIFNKELEIVK